MSYENIQDWMNYNSSNFSLPAAADDTNWYDGIWESISGAADWMEDHAELTKIIGTGVAAAASAYSASKDREAEAKRYKLATPSSSAIAPQQYMFGGNGLLASPEETPRRRINY